MKPALAFSGFLQTVGQPRAALVWEDDAQKTADNSANACNIADGAQMVQAHTVTRTPLSVPQGATDSGANAQETAATLQHERNMVQRVALQSVGRRTANCNTAGPYVVGPRVATVRPDAPGYGAETHWLGVPLEEKGAGDDSAKKCALCGAAGHFAENCKWRR